MRNAAFARLQPTYLSHRIPSTSELSAEDVVLAELLSCRGPAAWLSVSDEKPVNRTPLCQLARDCALLGQALTLGGGPVDMVLLPRPCATPEGAYFQLEWAQSGLTDWSPNTCCPTCLPA